MRCFAVTKAPIVRDDHPAMAAQQVTEIRWRLAEVEADGTWCAGRPWLEELLSRPLKRQS
jgi:hypothetical protein